MTQNKEQYRYELFDHHNSVLGIVNAEGLEAAAKHFVVKLGTCMPGFALVTSELGHELGYQLAIRWLPLKTVNEHNALLKAKAKLRSVESLATMYQTEDGFTGTQCAESLLVMLDDIRETLSTLAAIRSGN